MSVRHEHHSARVPDECSGMRLDQVLARLFGEYSRSAIKGWIERGLVRVNGSAARRPRDKVQANDALEMTATLDASSGLTPQAVDFRVVHSDAHLIVIDKPAGLVVHPGAGNPDRTLVNGLLARYPELEALPRAGLVHRIDKETSGLLVAGRTSAAFQQLVRDMAARRITRIYEAVVAGALVAGGTIEGAIARDPAQRTRMQVRADGRTAVTHYRVIRRYRAHSHIEVRLETGRTHQIRVHMAWRGHPVVGDRRYGGRRRLPPAAGPELIAALSGQSRHALHARRLSLCHPGTGETAGFEAPLPPDLLTLLAALDADLHGPDERP